MIGTLLFRARRALPDFPGRQRLFRLADRAFGPWKVKTPQGVKLRAYSASFMDAILIEGEAKPGSDVAVMGSEVAQLPEGGVFVDVGANIGLYSILAARRMGPKGRVFAFEPSPREFRRLLDNLDLNGAGTVTPISAALGRTPSLMDLHLATVHTGMNTLQVADSAAHVFEGAETRRVPVLNFDTAIAPVLGGARVDLLKIDVEGGELEVLRGMEKSLEAQLFKRMVIEITPAFLKAFGGSKEELYCLLSGHGYRAHFNSDADQYDELFIADERERRTIASPALSPDATQTTSSSS